MGAVDKEPKGCFFNKAIIDKYFKNIPMKKIINFIKEAREELKKVELAQ